MLVTTNYTTMSRKEFGFLLQQYLDGKCSEEEKAFVEHWFGLVQQAEPEAIEETDLKALEPLLWQQIESRITTDSSQSAKVLPLPVSTTWQRFWTVQVGGVAAAIGLVMFVGWWFYSGSANKPQTVVSELHQQTGWLIKTNSTNQPQLIQLVDGSTVRLSPGSSVQYPQQFVTNKREVRLVGDAFFDVQKMPAKPFLVYTNQVVTKVLGTSFFVKAPAGTKEVSVEVVTGRVAVYEQTEDKPSADNGVVLSPNQTATFFAEEQHFVTGLVAAPKLIQAPKSEPKAVSFRFDDAPLSEVLTRLEQAYGIAIEVESEQQNACLLTADLTGQPLYTQLDIICDALKATYKVQGTTILLSGAGCSD